MVSDEVETVRELYAARARGDVAVVRDLLHPEVFWREPGSAAYAGVHEGREAVIGELHDRMLSLTGGDFELELAQVVGHGPMVVVLVNWRAGRNGRYAKGKETAVYNVKGGQVVEACFHLDDTDAADEFFG